MPPQFRGSKTLRTGGTSAALDGLDGDDLNDGDLTFIHESDDTIYPYICDADGGAGESDPFVIVPDSNPGSINHDLQSIYPFMRSSYDLYIKQEYQDKDFYLQVNDGGVTKTPLFIDVSAYVIGINTTSPRIAEAEGLPIMHICDGQGTQPATTNKEVQLFIQNNTVDTDDAGIAIISGETSGSSCIIFGDKDACPGMFNYNNSDNSIDIYLGSNQRVQIDADGTLHLLQTGVLKFFTYQNDSLADDGTVSLPDATSGRVTVTCNAESGDWLVQNDGSCTKISGTANTADTDSDTDLCVYDGGGTQAIVKNRLGAAGEIRIFYFYN